jgi:signal peptidase I
MLGDRPMVKAGEPLLRGYIETGDHVFVDKFTYHFRRPARGEVFVFSTSGIRYMNRKGEPSQYYIKRLVGLPNDTLRIDPPNLYVNGQVAKEPGMVKVMTGTEKSPQYGYRGYCNMPPGLYEDEVGNLQKRPMTTPEETLTVPSARLDDPSKPELHYFAMGDNSYFSSDSRVWGPVPQENVMGRAVFVYWPFTRHWSLIR